MNRYEDSNAAESKVSTNESPLAVHDDMTDWLNSLNGNEKLECSPETREALVQLVDLREEQQRLVSVNVIACSLLFEFFVSNKLFESADKLLRAYTTQEQFSFLLEQITRKNIHNRLLRGISKKQVQNESEAQEFNHRVKLINHLFSALSRHDILLDLNASTFQREKILVTLSNLSWLKHDIYRTFLKVSANFDATFSIQLYNEFSKVLKTESASKFDDIQSCLVRRNSIPSQYIDEIYKMVFDYAAFLNAHGKHLVISSLDEMLLCVVSGDVDSLIELLEVNHTEFSDQKILLDFAALLKQEEVFQVLCPSVEVLADHFVKNKYQWALIVAYGSSLQPNSEWSRLKSLVEQQASQNRAASVEAARVLLPNMVIENPNELDRLCDLVFKGKISPNFRLANGDTLLHVYAVENNENRCRQLISVGAIPGLLNADNRSPWDVSEELTGEEFELDQAEIAELFSEEDQLNRLKTLKELDVSPVNQFFCCARSSDQSFVDYLVNTVSNKSFSSILEALFSSNNFEPYLLSVTMTEVMSRCFSLSNPNYLKALEVLKNGYFIDLSIRREHLLGLLSTASIEYEQAFNKDAIIFLFIYLKLRNDAAVLNENEKSMCLNLSSYIQQSEIEPLENYPCSETFDGFLNAILAILHNRDISLPEFILMPNDRHLASTICEEIDNILDAVTTPVIKNYLILTLLNSPAGDYLIDFEPAYLNKLFMSVEKQLGLSMTIEDYPNEPRHRRSSFYIDVLLAGAKINKRSKNPLAALKLIYSAKNYALRYLHESYNALLLVEEIDLMLDANRMSDIPQLIELFDQLSGTMKQSYETQYSISKVRRMLKQEDYLHVADHFRVIFSSLNTISTLRQLGDYANTLELFYASLDEIDQEQAQALTKLVFDCVISISLSPGWQYHALRLRVECLKSKINPEYPVDALADAMQALSNCPDGIFHPAYVEALWYRSEKLVDDEEVSAVTCEVLSADAITTDSITEEARQALYPIIEDSSSAENLLNKFHALLRTSMDLPDKVEDPDACYLEQASLLKMYTKFLVKLNLTKRAQKVYEVESLFALKQNARAIAHRYADYAESLPDGMAYWVNQRRCEVLESASCLMMALEISQKTGCDFDKAKIIQCIEKVGENWFIQLDYCFNSFFEFSLQQVDAALGLGEVGHNVISLSARLSNLSSNIHVVLGNVRDQSLHLCKYYYYDAGHNSIASGFNLATIDTYAPCASKEEVFHKKVSAYFHPDFFELSFAGHEEVKNIYQHLKDENNHSYKSKAFRENLPENLLPVDGVNVFRLNSGLLNEAIEGAPLVQTRTDLLPHIQLHDQVKRQGYGQHRDFFDYLYQQQPFYQNQLHLFNPLDEYCYDWLSAAKDFQDVAKHYHIPSMLLLNILQKRSGLIKQSVLQSYYGYIKQELTFEGVLQNILTEFSLLDETKRDELFAVITRVNDFVDDDWLDSASPEVLKNALLHIAMKLESAEGMSAQLYLVTNRIAQLMLRQQLVARNLIESPTAYLPTATLIRLNLHHSLQLIEYLQASHPQVHSHDTIDIVPENITDDSDEYDIIVNPLNNDDLDQRIDIDLRSEYAFCVEEYRCCLEKLAQLRNTLKNTAQLEVNERLQFNKIQFKAVVLAIKMRQLMDKIVVRRGRYLYKGSDIKQVSKDKLKAYRDHYSINHRISYGGLKVPYMKTAGDDYFVVDALLGNDLMKNTISDIIDEGVAGDPILSLDGQPVLSSNGRNCSYGELLREITNEQKHCGPQFFESEELAHYLEESNILPVREKNRAVVDLLGILRWGLNSSHRLLNAFSTKASEVDDPVDPERFQQNHLEISNLLDPNIEVMSYKSPNTFGFFNQEDVAVAATAAAHQPSTA